jgi:hypothetical protein
MKPSQSHFATDGPSAGQFGVESKSQSSPEQYLRILSVSQREHHISSLEISTGYPV